VRPLIGDIGGPDGTDHLAPKVTEMLMTRAKRHGGVVERSGHRVGILHVAR
jgi:hypothetical protein